MCRLIGFGKDGNARRVKRRIRSLTETRYRRSWLGDKHPYEIVMLFAGVASSVNPIHAQFLIRGQRRNTLALSSVRIESPAMVAALHLLPIEFPAGKRHSPVRTSIAKRKWNSLRIS